MIEDREELLPRDGLQCLVALAEIYPQDFAVNGSLRP